MPTTVPTNPSFALRTISDFTTWEDADGNFLGSDIYQDVAVFRANAAISYGDCVSFVAPTTTVPLSVTPSTTTASEQYRFVGVALEAASAGQMVQVCIRGVCEVNVGTADPVFGDIMSPVANTTAGVATVVTAANQTAAAIIAGAAGGVFLSADDATGTTTTAVVWLSGRF